MSICTDTRLDRRTYLLLTFSVQLTSLLTIVAATCLIALKIMCVTRQNRTHYSYTKIVNILVESAALVSIIAILVAILELLAYLRPYNVDTTTGRFFYELSQYIFALQTPILVSFLLFCIIVVCFNAYPAGNWTYSDCIPCCR